MARMSTTEARTPTARTAEPEGGVRGRTVLLGTLMIIAGIICLIVPRVAGVASIFYLGLLLAVSGLIEMLGGGRESRIPHRGLLVGGGLFSFAVGILLMARPMAGMAAVTLLLTGFFFASGLAAAVTSASERYGGWIWDLAFGVLSVLLGIIMLASWPRVAVWMVGTLVGVDIVIRGATMMSAGTRREHFWRTPVAG
jgi:uncharacterized membrane protein HdeD (DUF308 family)